MSIKLGRQYELTIYPPVYRQTATPGNTFIDQLKSQVVSLSSLLNEIQSISSFSINSLGSLLNEIQSVSNQVTGLVRSLQSVLNIPSSIINGLESQITQQVSSLLSSVESSIVIPNSFLNNFKNIALSQISSLTQFLPQIPAPFTSFNSFDAGGNLKPIVIKNPFTLIFNIKRSTISSTQSGFFQIYNLSQTTRSQLYKDQWSTWGLRRIVLKAGYASQGPLPVIFDGGMSVCNSHRPQGQINYITEIEADNWSFPTMNAITSQSFSGRVPKQKVVDQLIKDLINMGTTGAKINRGFVHQYSDNYYSPVISENSWNRLKTETDNACFIDLGNLHVLGDNEYIPGSVVTINTETGLLGAPKRFDTYVTAEILFESSLIVGQKVTLLTESQQIFNGDYLVNSLNHFGMISDAIGGKCQTNVNLLSNNKNAQLLSLNASTV